MLQICNMYIYIYIVIVIVIVSQKRDKIHRMSVYMVQMGCTAVDVFSL